MGRESWKVVGVNEGVQTVSEPTIYLQCSRTGRKYQVIDWVDGEPPMITLKGVNGSFTEPMRTVAEFAEIGYTRIIEPAEDNHA